MKDLTKHTAETQREFPHNWMAVISMLQISIRILEAIGLFFLPASIVTIISGSKVMFSIIFARIFLKKEIKKKDILTIVIMLTGLGFVGFSGYVTSKSSNNVSNLTVKSLTIGIPFILTSNLFSSLLYVTFEKALKKKKTDPLRFCSMSGLYGMMTNFTVILVASFVPCFSEDMCRIGGSLEDPMQAMNEIFENPKRQLYLGMYTVVITFYIFTLMYIAKNIGSVYLTVMKNTYCISIWITSVLLGLEGLELESFIYEFLGFLFIVFGTLMYNGMFLKDKSKVDLDNSESKGTISTLQDTEEDLMSEKEISLRNRM